MTKKEFLKEKEAYILNADNRIPYVKIKYIREGQEDYHKKLTLKNNPYNSTPLVKGKPKTIPNNYLSWDIGWRIEDLTTYALHNYDYLNHSSFNAVVLSSDWEA